MAVALAEAKSAFDTRTDPLPNGTFKSIISVRDVLGNHTVKVLDEQIALNGGNSAKVRQFILGHHEGAYSRNWKRHQGWQGDESIREYYIRRIEGSGVVIRKEIDVSQKQFTF